MTLMNSSGIFILSHNSVPCQVNRPWRNPTLLMCSLLAEHRTTRNMFWVWVCHCHQVKDFLEGSKSCLVSTDRIKLADVFLKQEYPLVLHCKKTRSRWKTASWIFKNSRTKRCDRQKFRFHGSCFFDQQNRYLYPRCNLLKSSLHGLLITSKREDCCKIRQWWACTQMKDPRRTNLRRKSKNELQNESIGEKLPETQSLLNEQETDNHAENWGIPWQKSLLLTRQLYKTERLTDGSWRKLWRHRQRVDICRLRNDLIKKEPVELRRDLCTTWSWGRDYTYMYIYIYIYNLNNYTNIYVCVYIYIEGSMSRESKTENCHRRLQSASKCWIRNKCEHQEFLISSKVSCCGKTSVCLSGLQRVP